MLTSVSSSMHPTKATVALRSSSRRSRNRVLRIMRKMRMNTMMSMGLSSPQSLITHSHLGHGMPNRIVWWIGKPLLMSPPVFGTSTSRPHGKGPTVPEDDDDDYDEDGDDQDEDEDAEDDEDDDDY